MSGNQNKLIDHTCNKGRKRNNKDYGSAHACCGFCFFGNAQERTQSQELAEDHVIYKCRTYNDKH